VAADIFKALALHRVHDNHMAAELAASIEPVLCAHIDDSGDPATLTVTGWWGYRKSVVWRHDSVGAL
jgi:hypothetical protein